MVEELLLLSSDPPSSLHDKALPGPYLPAWGPARCPEIGEARTWELLESWSPHLPGLAYISGQKLSLPGIS